ncbi:MAG: tRNA (guanine(10)-N(2))-dimethyltransferase [Candidatus Methanospirareceae archaeon]
MMLIEIKEGTTRLLVPQQHLTKSIFYNPRMELSRDIDIASIAVFASISKSHNLRYIDALAGTGVRGIRVANEVGLQATVNDRSTHAYELIKRNIRLNEVEDLAMAYNENANLLLLQTNYDMVDIDPFGSPVPFLDSACQSVKRMLLITATDTAPLCGAHTGGLRKYGAHPLNTEYHAEVGTRILLGAVTRELCRYEKAIRPLLSYASAHFIRIIARVETGAKKADESMTRLGFIAHCLSCGHRFSFSCEDMLEMRVRNKCTICGRRMRIAGPLYISAIREREFCERVHEALGKMVLNKKKEAMKIVHRSIHELDIPFFYELHALCKDLKIPPPSIHSLLHALHSNGFSASRTSFSDTGVKTDARINELKTLVKSL